MTTIIFISKNTVSYKNHHRRFYVRTYFTSIIHDIGYNTGKNNLKKNNISYKNQHRALYVLTYYTSIVHDLGHKMEKGYNMTMRI